MVKSNIILESNIENESSEEKLGFVLEEPSKSENYKNRINLHL